MSGIFTLFNFSTAGEYLPDLFRGAIISIELTLSVMALSLVFGLIVALMRMTRFRAVRTVATFYIEIIRGTPALLQLFYIYFVLPAFGIKLPPFTAGVIGLTVNYSAYLSEVYRAGIQAVAKGQLEAAQALGMSRSLMMRLIILPQAIRIIVPPLGNYFISLFKDTALASLITVKELIFTGQIIAATNFQYFAIFTIIGGIYLIISYPGSLGVQYLERRMKIGYRPRGHAPMGGPTRGAPQGAVS
jgi:ectoine/hydroxyectoine ABC transporter permease protein EhuD